MSSIRLAIVLIVSCGIAVQPVTTWAQYQALDVRAVSPIGEGGMDWEMIAGARAVAVSAGREVFVLDGGDRNVKVFTAVGRFLRAFGRAGAGPGELMRPLSIHIRSDTVVVVDAANGDVIFDLSGRHLGTVGPQALRDRSLALRGGTAIWQQLPVERLTGPGAPTEHLGDYAVVIKTARDSARTLIRYSSDLAPYRTAQGSTLLLSSGFGNGGAWTVVGDTGVVIADGYTGWITRYTVTATGNLTVATRDSLRVPIKAVSWADRTRAAERVAGATGSFGRASPPNRARPGAFAETPSNWSVASQLIPGTDGSVWIGAPRLISEFQGTGSSRQLSSFVDGNRWYRFAAHSIDVSVQLPSRFQVRAVIDDCFLGIDLEREVAGVLRYCLVR